jgi:TRAP-type C4-dicarboxylate transport system permease small subunit
MSKERRPLPEGAAARRPGLAALAALTERARRALQAVSVALLTAYACLTLLQVFFRYVLNQPLFWAEEVVRYGLVWSVLLGSALVAHDREHIRIEVLGPLFGGRAQMAIEFLANLLTFVFILILVVAGVQFVSRTMFQHSASLGVPMWTVYAAVPIGAAIEAWFMLFPRQGADEPHKEAML